MRALIWIVLVALPAMSVAAGESAPSGDPQRLAVLAGQDVKWRKADPVELAGAKGEAAGSVAPRGHLKNGCAKDMPVRMVVFEASATLAGNAATTVDPGWQARPGLWWGPRGLRWRR